MPKGSARPAVGRLGDPPGQGAQAERQDGGRQLHRQCRQLQQLRGRGKDLRPWGVSWASAAGGWVRLL